MHLVHYRPSILSCPIPGELAYYDDAELPRLLESLPDGSELFGSLHDAKPVRINIPGVKKKKKGALCLCPQTVWGGIEPDFALETWDSEFGFSAPTPGGSARKLVRESLKGVPLYGHNGIARELERIKQLSTSYFLGPMARQLESNIEGDACVIDLNAAYLEAMARYPLPYGRPYHWGGPIAWDGAWKGSGVIPEGLAGMVECAVLDRNLWHGCKLPEVERHAYLEQYIYRGTWFELQQGVERGRLEIPSGSVLSGLVWNTSINGQLEGWLQSWMADPEKKQLAKLVYTRGWVQHVWPGYRRGIVARDPGQMPTGYVPDPDQPWIGWRIATPDPEEDPRILNVLQRPERSAHVIGVIRSRLLDLSQDILSSGGQVGQILVDAVVATKAKIPAWATIGTSPGTWKIEDSDDFPGIPAVGEYQASTPGRYQIRERGTGRMLRNRHSGLEEPLSWDEFRNVVSDGDL